MTGLASFFLGLRGHQVIERQLGTHNRIEVILPRIATRCFHEKEREKSAERNLGKRCKCI